MLHAAAASPLRLVSISSRFNVFPFPLPSNLSLWIPILYYHHEPFCSIKSYFSVPDNATLDSFDHLLQQCSTARQCKQVHNQILIGGAHHSEFLAARIVSIYARFGLVFYAQKLFDTSPFEHTSNLLLWNSILRANVSHGYIETALKIYVKMRKQGIFGDAFTFPLVIRACAFLGSSYVGKNIHNHVLQTGNQNCVHVVNELLGMYAKLGKMDVARHLFDKMCERNKISWNMMISGFALNYDCDGASEMLERMELEGLEPDDVTWTSLLSSHARCGRNQEALKLFDSMRMGGIRVSAEALAVMLSVCADLVAFNKGKAIHVYVVKCGFESHLFVKNALICLYGKHGNINDARNVFLEMENKNIVSWNGLITSYAEAGLCDEASALLSQLERSGNSSAMRPNVISWSAVIGAFASQGREEESLDLFRKMQLANIMANSVTISSVLSACAELVALNLGREIHGHVVRALMSKNILVANGLVNMYAKCGCLKEGHSVFEKIEVKDTISWNSMITGYGMNGHGEKALTTFHEMIEAGFQPDGVTFIAILSACSHAGLVAKGRKFFNMMIRDFGIKPQMEHYACMIDLLGRAGILQEAIDIIKGMPMEPNVCVWGALLNSCQMHKNTEVADQIASQILSPDLNETGGYMLLSNIYSASGRWEDSATVRISARTKGLKKIPGHSWIEVKKKVYMFSAGSTMQLGLEEVYCVLDELALQMESENHTFDDSFVEEDGEEEKLALWAQ
ncbi:hypothetical protein SLA2020_473100 [Shorea laevis]